MDPDQAPTCGSWVEITEDDLRGPFRMALTEAEHPARRDHPDVKVAICDHRVTYTWIKAERMCDAPHPDADDFVCARPVDHRHGHGMWGMV